MYFTFRRTELAIAYCDSLAGNGIANATSGLFLAAPRRVGKSTFLLNDLIPEAKKRGWTTIYIDLWVNINANPADIIAEAIKNKILELDSKFTKIARKIGLDKINVMGTFVLNFSSPGLPENITLTDALRILYEIADAPILLIIDEAQQALINEKAMSAMFAIKSARDQLNSQSAKTALMLAFTGSNRDKLAHLVLKKSHPFFGSDVTSFPLLNKNYTDAFTHWVNNNLAPDNQFSEESMYQAFKLVGHRPEILRQIAGKIALSGEASNFAELLKKDALTWQNRVWEEYENDFNTLSPLQKIILQVLIKKEQSWLPFSEESMQTYSQLTGQEDISTATVQTAIQSLRERGLLWQSGRGTYALEDESFAEWYKLRSMKNEMSL